VSRAAVVAAVLVCFTAGRLTAECRVPKNSNEAKLLAFYSMPIAFSPANAPDLSPPWTLRIGAEGGLVPEPDSAIRQSGICFTKKTENTGLSSVFGRPRLTLKLPKGFSLEGSYLPPINFGEAEPNLGSAALSWTQRIRMAPTGNATEVMLRAHGTFGEVRGPITCPRDALQQSNATQPCYGTSPSHDTFKPNMFGVEGVVSTAAWDGRLAFYGGVGENFLRPRFQVGFTDALGAVDNTQVTVDLSRLAMFAGASAEVSQHIDLSAQAYGQRNDGVTFRVGGGYRLYR
jgi:hypothetical protein